MIDGHKEAVDELKLALAAVRRAKTNIRYAMNLHRMPDSRREGLAGTLLKVNELEKLLITDFVRARSA